VGDYTTVCTENINSYLLRTELKLQSEFALYTNGCIGQETKVFLNESHLLRSAFKMEKVTKIECGFS